MFVYTEEDIAAMEKVHWHEIASDYADHLLEFKIPCGDHWTRDSLTADTEEHIAIASRELQLIHKRDVMEYLYLRHRVGPNLWQADHVRNHLLAHKGKVADGLRILHLVANTPPSLWLEFRGIAGYDE